MAAKRGIANDQLGRKSLYYLGGLAEGTETILFLVLACLLPNWFTALALGFGAICWITTFGRVVSGFQLLREQTHRPA
jgi:hypothetical protein